MLVHHKVTPSIKVAEHSFRARFCWCNSARAQGLQKTSMPSIDRSFCLLDTRTICTIFLYNWTQCINGFSLLSQRYVRKGNDAKNPTIPRFFFINEEPSEIQRMRSKSENCDWMRNSSLGNTPISWYHLPGVQLVRAQSEKRRAKKIGEKRGERKRKNACGQT